MQIPIVPLVLLVGIGLVAIPLFISELISGAPDERPDSRTRSASVDDPPHRAAAFDGRTSSNPTS